MSRGYTSCVLLSLLLLSCQETVTTDTGRPYPQAPRPQRPTPSNVEVDAMVLNLATAPRDTNANGYPDLIYATAHLFDLSHPEPVREDGSFLFALYVPGEAADPEAAPIRIWRIRGDDLERTLARSAFGVCYQFRLSLLEQGTDVIPLDSADMLCLFQPADGRDPVPAGEVSTIQIGHRVNVPRAREVSGSE